MRLLLVSAVLLALLGGLAAPASATTDMARVPVLKRPVSTGEVIDGRDIEMVQMRLDQIGRTVMLSRDALVGLAAKRMLSPGRPIQSGDVQRPVMVSKGGAVTMLVQLPGMFLSAQGKALDAGAQGDTILVMNTQTNRTVQAIVTGPSEVRVMSSAPRLR